MQTSKALEADVALAKQLWLAQWQQHRCWWMIIQIENPEGALENHPLTREVVLKTFDEGGLGCDLTGFDNCIYGSRSDPGKEGSLYKKPESIFTNNEYTLAKTDGYGFRSMHRCTPEHPCRWFQKHGRHDHLEGGMRISGSNLYPTAPRLSLAPSALQRHRRLLRRGCLLVTALRGAGDLDRLRAARSPGALRWQACARVPRAAGRCA